MPKRDIRKVDVKRIDGEIRKAVKGYYNVLYKRILLLTGIMPNDTVTIGNRMSSPRRKKICLVCTEK